MDLKPEMPLVIGLGVLFADRVRCAHPRPMKKPPGDEPSGVRDIRRFQMSFLAMRALCPECGAPEDFSGGSGATIPGSVAFRH